MCPLVRRSCACIAVEILCMYSSCLDVLKVATLAGVRLPVLKTFSFALGCWTRLQDSNLRFHFLCDAVNVLSRLGSAPVFETERPVFRQAVQYRNVADEDKLPSGHLSLLRGFQIVFQPDSSLFLLEHLFFLYRRHKLHYSCHTKIPTGNDVTRDAHCLPKFLQTNITSPADACWYTHVKMR